MEKTPALSGLRVVEDWCHLCGKGRDGVTFFDVDYADNAEHNLTWHDRKGFRICVKCVDLMYDYAHSED